MNPILFHILLILAATSSAGFLGNSTSWAETEANEDADDSLLALPYIQYVKDEAAPKKVGTTIYKKNKTSPGYNIYTSDDNAKEVFANLIDMDGTLVHQWKKQKSRNAPSAWKVPAVFPDGSLLLCSGRTQTDWQLVDVDSNILATYDLPQHRAHHAIYYLRKDGFLSLTENTLNVPFKDLVLKVNDNSLVHISPEGRPIKIISLHKLFAKDPSYQKRLQESYLHFKNLSSEKQKNKTKNPSYDLFHANNIANLEWDIPGVAKRNNWLVTIRHLNKIIIVDPKKEEIVWEWGENEISRPHHASFLNSTQILLLDNGVNKKSSRVVVLDINSKRIIWQYGQKPGQKFYSHSRGAAERLPNGNTLITESAKGRVFEVTPSGEIVWEWYANFFTEGPHKGKRRVLYRMQRVPYDFFKDTKFNYGQTLATL